MTDLFLRWALISAIACAIGGLLIRLQPIGRATALGWIGSRAVRWGFRAGHGRLPAAVLISWLVWLVIGAAAIGAGHYRDDLPRLLLILGWASEVLLIFYLIGMWLMNWNANPAFRRKFLTMAGMVLLLLGASMRLWFKPEMGLQKVAVMIAAIPLGVAIIYGVFVAALMLLGGKARWN